MPILDAVEPFRSVVARRLAAKEGSRGHLVTCSHDLFVVAVDPSLSAVSFAFVDLVLNCSLGGPEGKAY